MIVKNNNVTFLTRLYAGSRYMKETLNGTDSQYTYLGGDAYSAPVVAVTTGGSTIYYYLIRDYLGNITHVYNSSNSTTREYSYDAWGRRRNAADWSYDLTGQPELFADRGYTSHEHLTWFNLINMNGRLYDPLVGAFVSPDPSVQAPDNTQGMNRYTYCMNNPLRYVDPSGYTWFGSFFRWAGKAVCNVVVNVVVMTIAVPIVVAVTAVSTVVGVGKGVFTGDWSTLKNDVKIVGGLFTGSPGQIFSRFTWELPQTIAGYVASQGSNIIGDVRNVSYYDGATVVQHYSDKWGAFTLGSYINTDRGSDNQDIMHEYGHYLQSQSVGPLYLYNYAIPSLIDASKYPKSDPHGQMKHNAFGAEQDANVRARNYFGDAKWNYGIFPIFNSGKNDWYDSQFGQYRTIQGQNTTWWESALIMALCIGI